MEMERGEYGAVVGGRWVGLRVVVVAGREQVKSLKVGR